MKKVAVGFISGAVLTAALFQYADPGFMMIPDCQITIRDTGSQQEVDGTPQVTQKTEMSARVVTAISIISTRSENEQASDYVISAIKLMTQGRPDIQALFQKNSENGLSNKEATEIFEKFYSEQAL